MRDLMIESVEHRFGIVDQLPHAVEWLSDNGSYYTATETISFAKDMGFISCFFPVRSPESNGVAEAFVKTFKRDHVYVHNRLESDFALRRSIAPTDLASRIVWSSV